MVPQQQSRIFSLPPELRNRIYAMVFENGKDSINLIRKFGHERHRYLTAQQMSERDEAAPLDSALLRTCQRVYQESVGIFKTTLESYWSEEFLVKLTDSASCRNAYTALNAKGMNSCIHRIRNLTYRLKLGALHISLKLRKKTHGDWDIDFINESTFDNHLAQAWIDRRCRKILARWLVFDSHGKSRSKNLSYGFLTRSNILDIVDQMDFCGDQEGLLTRLAVTSRHNQIAVLGFAL